MNVGIVTKWFNSGQAVVSRQLRSALEGSGHRTFILAREGRGPRAGAARPDDAIWDQPGITYAPEAEIPLAEYERWSSERELDAILWDNDYGFEQVQAIRRRGVRTIGRFVWEHFSDEHADPARGAYDVIYSLTRAEQQRYRGFGLETPYIVWGCHPELLEVKPDGAAASRPGAAGSGGDAPEEAGVVRFLVPGSFLGRRKPLAETLEAFTRTRDPRLRLLLKAQVKRREGMLGEAVGRDSRIELILEDQPTDEHLRMSAACDVCLNPIRWEGLGLPLFEAMAFGQPVITNDNPPMNEVVRDDVNGLLVGARADGVARSGITAWTPEIGELAGAIERLGDDELRARLAAGARATREGERSWERTVTGFRELLESVA